VDPEAIVAVLRVQLVPEAGTTTSYDLPLQVENARQFVDWFYDIELTEEERSVQDEALLALDAPCCSETSDDTCCCECDLVRGVLGLAGHLIREHGFDVDGVRQSADEWLRFVQGDYYVAAALKEWGYAPEAFGLGAYESCSPEPCRLPETECGCPETAESLLAGPASAASGTDLPAFGRISLIAAHAVISTHRSDPTLVILDVRKPGEYAAGHIEGAVSLYYSDPAFSDELKQLDTGRIYLVYCRKGNVSRDVVATMASKGTAGSTVGLTQGSRSSAASSSRTVICVSVIYRPLTLERLADVVCCPLGLKRRGNALCGDIEQVEVWRARMIGLGLRGLVAYADGEPRGFAEYMPAETSPLPIDASGAAVLMCYHWAGTEPEADEHLDQERRMIAAVLDQTSGAFAGLAALGGGPPYPLPDCRA
jgi:rhodanese-related sulfurtransferase